MDAAESMRDRGVDQRLQRRSGLHSDRARTDLDRSAAIPEHHSAAAIVRDDQVRTAGNDRKTGAGFVDPPDSGDERGFGPGVDQEIRRAADSETGILTQGCAGPYVEPGRGAQRLFQIEACQIKL